MDLDHRIGHAYFLDIKSYEGYTYEVNVITRISKKVLNPTYSQ